MALEREITYVLKVRDEASGALAKFKGAAIGATAALAGIGLITKQAIDFESAFAGVVKTVDDASDDFGNLTDIGRQLREEFLDLSTIIPVTANELASVGESAGQLGIQTKNIIGFTKVMAELGVATELSSKEAAVSLAQLANITQFPQENFDRLGATLVDLGNSFATNEPRIVEMGLRLASAANVVGFTEQQTLGLATALASLGLKAQAGGTAISRVLLDIAQEVATTGDRLDLFAETAGLAVDDFAVLFKKDAPEAMTLFVEGLQRIQQEGGSVIVRINELGLSSVRIRDALLRAAGAGDIFRRAIADGSRAFEENTALIIEANKRFRTVASQMQLVKNRAQVLSIRLGDALLPAILQILAAVTPLINKFADWAKENQETVGTVLKIVAGVSLLTIGFFALVAAVIPVLAILGGILLIGPLVVAKFAAIGAAIVLFVLFWNDFVDAGIRALQGFSDNLNRLVEVFVAAFTAINEFVGGVIEGLKQRFDGFVDGMIQKIAKLLSAAKNVTKVLSGGGFAERLGQSARQAFDRLEHGGFARQPFSLVGEAGPELVSLPRGSFVTPAAETREILQNRQNNVTINLGGVTLREEADEDRLVDKIARSIQLQSLASA